MLNRLSIETNCIVNHQVTNLVYYSFIMVVTYNTELSKQSISLK